MSDDLRIKAVSNWIQDGLMWNRIVIVEWIVNGKVIQHSTHLQAIEGDVTKATTDHLCYGHYFHTPRINEEVLYDFNNRRELLAQPLLNKWKLSERDGKQSIVINMGWISHSFSLEPTEEQPIEESA